MRFQQEEGHSRGTVKLGGGWLTPCDGVPVSALCNTTKPLLHYCLPPVVSVVSSQPPRSQPHLASTLQQPSLYRQQQQSVTAPTAVLLWLST